MVTFIDGPAKDVELDILRTPIILRVVVNRAGTWDALDQPEDTPKPTEAIHVYRLESRKMTGMIDFRGKGGRREGRPFVCATYRHCPLQPGPDVDCRSIAGWAMWCDVHAAELLAGVPFELLKRMTRDTP